jgi:heme exporter protein D
MTASEFFQMGGYAFYVWTSYGLALIVLLANFFSAWKRHREARQRADRPLRQGARP